MVDPEISNYKALQQRLLITRSEEFALSIYFSQSKPEITEPFISTLWYTHTKTIAF